MEPILECCCGLDIHRDTIVACLIKGSLSEKPETVIRTFFTLAHDRTLLRDWLIEEECYHIAMESTGVYWQPIYNVLEEIGSVELLVVNAYHMRNVPGRKTDMKDAQWIATLLRAGLLKGSFIPSKEIRELRDLTRYRKFLVEAANAQKNRINKLLQANGFKLTTVMSDPFGVSGSNIMRHLSQYGELPIELLDGYLKGTLRNKKDEVALAVSGCLSQQQRRLLSMELKHLETMQNNVQEVEHEIAIVLAKFQDEVELTDSIPGIDITAAASIIGEIGVDMSKFPTTEQICSWAGVTPGDNESAGKKKSVKTKKSKRYLKSLLCEIAWSITNMRKTYLSTWYWKVKQRRGSKKAIIALSRKILTIIYAVLKTKTPFKEELYKQKQDNFQHRRNQAMIKELVRQGYQIVPQNC